ncbi:MAG: lysyl oxidase family protein [Planctomycetaceae bacterium]|nr:lysyl oxidase family protein [Planctomycetaceae bacterium]
MSQGTGFNESTKRCFVVLCAALIAVAGSHLTMMAAPKPPLLPDLIIDEDWMQSSLKTTTAKFGAGDCANVEGCVRGTGKRTLLKFDVVIGNMGAADFRLGDPAAQENQGLFEWSGCHGHYHLTGFASYELLNQSNNAVVTGRKQAFCLLDTVKIDQTAGLAKYSCANQGITVGWADVYDSSLDCQWLDITGVPAGNYWLKVVVNADSVSKFNANLSASIISKLKESSYGNNTAIVPVTIKR